MSDAYAHTNPQVRARVAALLSGWDRQLLHAVASRHGPGRARPVLDAVPVTDRQAARVLLPQLRTRFQKITMVWADGGYTGRLVTWAREKLQLTLEIVKRSDDVTGFVVLRRRWVVERTLGWLMRTRRLVRDFETLPASSEAFIYFSQAMLMSRRLARPAVRSRSDQSRWAAAA
ncbi:transposase [Streptomyces sp. NPDC019443]|uniref:transposase n=1 Tax=Streptomyces sp. NPDC019443 TaxID=3365061 RepID=UPI0037A709CA